MFPPRFSILFFFFNDTATTEIYTLSLHDALPISPPPGPCPIHPTPWATSAPGAARSEEHTSELQSRGHLVCRLLLDKKKKPACEVATAISEACNCTPDKLNTR